MNDWGQRQTEEGEDPCNARALDTVCDLSCPSNSCLQVTMKQLAFTMLATSQLKQKTLTLVACFIQLSSYLGAWATVRYALTVAKETS